MALAEPQGSVTEHKLSPNKRDAAARELADGIIRRFSLRTDLPRHSVANARCSTYPGGNFFAEVTATDGNVLSVLTGPFVNRHVRYDSFIKVTPPSGRRRSESKSLADSEEALSEAQMIARTTPLVQRVIRPRRARYSGR